MKQYVYLIFEKKMIKQLALKINIHIYLTLSNYKL